MVDDASTILDISLDKSLSAKTRELLVKVSVDTIARASDFCRYFWNEANGKKPILKAVQAAEMRASTNARPVFIGNNTFYGNAN